MAGSGTPSHMLTTKSQAYKDYTMIYLFTDRQKSMCRINANFTSNIIQRKQMLYSIQFNSIQIFYYIQVSGTIFGTKGMKPLGLIYLQYNCQYFADWHLGSAEEKHLLVKVHNRRTLYCWHFLCVICMTYHRQQNLSGRHSMHSHPT